jgi:peptide deformylase
MIITDVDILHEISVEVSSVEEETDIIEKLEQELYIANRNGASGIGLAAPQIGIKKKIAIIRIDEHTRLNLVNAEIISANGKFISREGCLSVPGKLVEVERSLDIIIKNCGFINVGKFAAYGLPAVCIQHEMDHWDGILMTDRVITKHTETGPNMLCPCGSKIKYKKCCMRKQGEKDDARKQ